MNPVTVVIGGVGALLIYCAVTDQDPRTVVANALSGKGKRKPRNVSGDIVPPTLRGDTSYQDSGETPDDEVSNVADYVSRVGN